MNLGSTGLRAQAIARQRAVAGVEHARRPCSGTLVVWLTALGPGTYVRVVGRGRGQGSHGTCARAIRSGRRFVFVYNHIINTYLAVHLRAPAYQTARDAPGRSGRALRRPGIGFPARPDPRVSLDLHKAQQLARYSPQLRLHLFRHRHHAHMLHKTWRLLLLVVPAPLPLERCQDLIAPKI